MTNRSRKPISDPEKYTPEWIRLAALDRAFTVLQLRPLGQDRTHEEFLQKLFETADRINRHLSRDLELKK